MKQTAGLVLILVLGWCAPLWSTDYFVSPTGNDANAGTSAGAPWQSTTNVNATTIVAGDRLLFEGGKTNAGNVFFFSDDGGNATNPVVITSYGTGRATLDAGNGTGIYSENSGSGFVISNLNFIGQSRTNGVGDQYGIFFFNYVSDFVREHIYVSNVDISGFSRFGIWIGPYNSAATALQDVRITDSDLHDNGESGLLIDANVSYTITNVYVGNIRAFNNAGNTNNTTPERGIDVGDTDGGVIERCVAYNNGSRGEGGTGIHVYDSNNMTVQYNESFNNHTRLTTGGAGFHIDNKMSNSRVQYNYSHGNDGPGFWLMHEDVFYTDAYTNNAVRYNISENDARRNTYGAVDVQGELDLAEIHNNTVFLIAGSGTSAAVRVHNEVQPSLDVHGVHFRNNILQTTNSVRLMEVTDTELDTGSDLLFQGNTYYTSGGGFDITWSNIAYSTLSAWSTAIGATGVGTNVNPRLANPGNGGVLTNAYHLNSLSAYKLTYGSPMIDHGLALSTLFGLTSGSLDFYSNSVPAAGGYDMGAHESTDVLPTRVSITNGFLTLKFARTSPLAAELTYAGETSSNLVNWCTASCVTTQVSNNGDGTETVTITDGVAVNSTRSRFLRVRITRLP